MKLQNIIFTAIKTIYPDATQNFRPDWIQNPATGKNLEIDIYIPSLKLGFEVQGIHHRLERQSYRDALKLALANKQDVKIVYFEKRKEIAEYLERIGFKDQKTLRRIRKYKMSRYMFKTYGVQYQKQLLRDNYFRWSNDVIKAQQDETESIRRRRANGSTL